MRVQAQFITVDMDKSGSMFDFQVMFYIINPADENIIAKYIFDKNSTKKEEKESAKILKENLTKQIGVFKGVIPANVNDSKPFRFNTLTDDKSMAAKSVDAQVDLASFNKNSFTISVSLVKKKGNSVDVSFEGDKPSWLTDKAIFPGKLVMVELVDVGPKKVP
jgi:hypothetical protein